MKHSWIENPNGGSML
jgi:hypothetical protein